MQLRVNSAGFMTKVMKRRPDDVSPVVEPPSSAVAPALVTPAARPTPKKTRLILSSESSVEEGRNGSANTPSTSGNTVTIVVPPDVMNPIPASTAPVLPSIGVDNLAGNVAGVVAANLSVNSAGGSHSNITDEEKIQQEEDGLLDGDDAEADVDDNDDIEDPDASDAGPRNGAGDIEDEEEALHDGEVDNGDVDAVGGDDERMEVDDEVFDGDGAVMQQFFNEGA